VKTRFLNKEIFAELKRRSVALKAAAAASHSLGDNGRGRDDEVVKEVAVLGDYVYTTRLVHGSPVLSRRRRTPSSSSDHPVTSFLNLLRTRDVQKEEVVLDATREFAPKYGGYFHPRMISLSDDHKMLALVADVKGTEEYTLFIKNIETGTLLSQETTPNVVTAHWLAGRNDALVYTTSDASMRPFQVSRREVGRPREKDEVLYRDDDEQFFVDIYRSKDRQAMFVTSNSKISSETHLLDPGTGLLTLLKKREPNVEYYVEHAGKRFIILTNQNCPNFKVSCAPVESPSHGGLCFRFISPFFALRGVVTEPLFFSLENWADLFLPARGSMIEDIEVFRDRVVVSAKKEGLPDIRVLSLDTNSVKKIPLPDNLCTVSSEAANQDFESKVFTMSVSSPLKPPQTHIFDMVSEALDSTSSGLQQTLIGDIDLAHFTVERVMVPSGEVQVPLTLIHRKDVKLNSSNPTIVFGYGAYGVSLEPAFHEERLSLLRRGWVLALAHVRYSLFLFKSGFFEHQQ